MDKVDFLNYRALLLEADQLRSLLATLASDRYSVPGPGYSGPSHRARSKGATFETKVVRYSEAAELYERKLAELDAQTLAVERCIETLTDPVERLLMRLRYIEGQRWVNVCVALQDLGYSERQVYRLHGSALEKLKGVCCGKFEQAD
jgi:hypothetical protein